MEVHVFVQINIFMKSHNLCFFHVYKKIRSPPYHYFLHLYYRFTSVSIKIHKFYMLGVYPCTLTDIFFKNSYFFRFLMGGGVK